jgi:hypothetical protein
MKEAELRQHARCSLCRNPILSSGLPLFWRVTVERFGLDMQAVRRQDGLGAFLGHAGLAAVMGPDEDMATPMMPPVVLAVCETCAGQSELPIAVLAEIGERT